MSLNWSPQPHSSTPAWNIRTIVPAALFVLGAAFRLRLFFANGPLSIDEAALTRTLVDRPWLGLVGPLDFAQVAPLGYLFVEKGLVTLLGGGERSLRTFPVVCGVAALWLCWAVSRRMMAWSLAVCVLAVFAINRPLIEYSAIAKPYSADVAATLLIALIAIEVIDRPMTGARSWRLGLAGAATPLFSFTAVFSLVAGSLAVLVAAVRQRGKHPMGLWLHPSALWLTGAVTAALANRLLVDPLDSEYLRFWWSSGFMPMSSALTAAAWTWRGLENLISQTGGYRGAIGWLALTVIGVASLYRRRPDLLLLLGAPLGLALITSAARLYPFAPGRLQLFLLPFVVIVAVEGAASFLRFRRARVVRAIPLVGVMALAAVAALAGPERSPAEDIRPFLQHAKANWRPGDRLWVYYPLGQAFLYYAPRFGFAQNQYAIATCAAGSARRYLRELDDQLEGSSRGWIVIPHNQVPEVSLIHLYVNAMGTMDAQQPVNREEGIDSTRIGYLVNLSAPGGEGRGDRFSVPAEIDRPEPYPWMCHGVMQPLHRMPHL